MHGYEAEELIGKHFSMLYREDQRAFMEKRRKRIYEMGSAVDEVWHERKDGTTFPVLATGTIVKGERGKPLYIAATHLDITQRKKMQEQLMVTDRLASIGELVSGVAHEINNPLTGVIGFSEMLMEKETPDDVKEDLEIINREAKRTANIVRNLLTFARRHPEEKQSVNINEIIQEVLNLRAYAQKVHNIDVRTHFAKNLPQITANSFQLKQVFINLIINAEYFMTEAHGEGTLTITTERIRKNIRVSFADDGPGITEENLNRLFNPFFTTKEVGKGTGLGLSICHGIVTGHGGKIYAESELGKGATFIVELPIADS
jgi:PAS domain S-box-containing protein